MNQAPAPSFLEYLRRGIAAGGFETDDVLATLLPLFEQVHATHARGLVAPLDGVDGLYITEGSVVAYTHETDRAPRSNLGQVEKLQAPVTTALDVVGQVSQVSDINAFSLHTTNDLVSDDDGVPEKPVYRTQYRHWEHAVGHHDAVSDVYSLGMLLASVACGLDFTDSEDLAQFVNHRRHLFRLRARLNPVVASVIVQMTELNRHRRAQDLPQLIHRLRHYREQPLDVASTLLASPEFQSSPLSGKRRQIQNHLRDRLFEISRRNRLIYFKPTLQSLNLTVASVPILLDYRNIRREDLFLWHPALARTLTEGEPLSLGRYLRFEDAPYIPGVLDKILSEARRDRAEYGFAQLRLVICFLRWHNLKEEREERIDSPLLLLPVELSRKKGVRDAYILDPTSSESEVNPALRHHLKELYNLVLPEFIDLKQVTLDAFYENLRAQIQASEPGVLLEKIEKPQIELIHAKARQRVDQYRQRTQLQARAQVRKTKPDDASGHDGSKAQGLELFIQKVRPSPLPLRDATDPGAAPRQPNMVGTPSDTPETGTLEASQRRYAIHDGGQSSPYSWEFDLCSLTLGNFNYRKMTLVRDYAKLIETDLACSSFDDVFSLQPRPAEPAPTPAIPLADQHLVIACDATQASAIQRARTGASYIIQGPPGTGKSQTITNLIADYVARGKRVLFVCEKRAAIDVVFQRLRQQGLDELCCLIHDSQTDKKAFIQNLKQTYDKFLDPATRDTEAETVRARKVAAMEQDLASLQRFSEGMREEHPSTGLPLRTLIHRLVQLRGSATEIPLPLQELLPDYPLWLRHGDWISRLSAALQELEDETCFAQHPLRWLGPEILCADRPVTTLKECLETAEDLLDVIEEALDMAQWPGAPSLSLNELDALVQFAVLASPLAERGLLNALTSTQAHQEYERVCRLLDQKAAAAKAAQSVCQGWKTILSKLDTESALDQARRFQNSIFRFLQPSFWRLKKVLQSHYDFSAHAVPPPWTRLLEELSALHAANAALQEAQQQAAEQWHSTDVTGTRETMTAVTLSPLRQHPAVRHLLDNAGGSTCATDLVQALGDLQPRFQALKKLLTDAFWDMDSMPLPRLREALSTLTNHQDTLTELAPLLSELCALPEPLAHAVRKAPAKLDDFEGLMGHRSLLQVYRTDRGLLRFNGQWLRTRMEQLRREHQEWLALNARCIRSQVRTRFLENVGISGLPAAQLTAEQKIFKRTYATGRRELEHEFGKSMRYRSIRDLAAGDSGRVIQDLKPIWLMSPLSVSDTLPLDPTLFDVVIFDEASQIPMEEAVPAVFRANQTIVVGDEMQLPPTSFFASARGSDQEILIEEEGTQFRMDLDSDSFLRQSARNLPSTLLAWHYRSRSESLISFSNAAFYSGNLYTIPDRQCTTSNRPEIVITDTAEADRTAGELLQRSISFHFMRQGVYDNRRNVPEATYVARLVRALLLRGTGLSIGVVAFSEAQQSEIEGALSQLAEEDPTFGAALEAEYTREDNDVFCGLFVKNLENVQGDERDIILLSVCYGFDPNRRILMNFGPINQRGGEKRLNVIFSRARHHMAVVSSMRHGDITNEANDGANSLKQYLHYAEAASTGDTETARRVLENLNPIARRRLATGEQEDAVVHALAQALRTLGFDVTLNVGQSRFRCHLAVRPPGSTEYQLGILVDTDADYANTNALDRYLLQPSILKAFGWQVVLVLTKDWYHDPESVLAHLKRILTESPQADATAESDGTDRESEPQGSPEPAPAKPAAHPTLSTDNPEESTPTPQNPPVPKTPTTAAETRRFEFKGGASSKFWEITLQGCDFHVRFGRIGSSGQSQSKTLPTPGDARAEVDRLIVEKLKKGYVEIRVDSQAG